MSHDIPERDSKIRPTHLERLAYVYVRQSSPKQVTDHAESGHRQYALVDWACPFGEHA